MYNQYIPGDLLYSRLYEYDQPQEPEVPAVSAETVSQTALATENLQTQAADGKTKKNAGLTGILDGFGLGSMGNETLLLLAFLYLFLGKGGKSIFSPALLGLLFLGLGKEET